MDPGPLHTTASRIVDASGRAVRLTGVNWSGLETPTFAPRGLDRRRWCDLLDDIERMGFNTLRLPFSNQLFDPDSAPNGIDFDLNPDLQGLSGIQIMDRIIAGARERGLKIILDRHRPDAQAQAALWYTGTYPEARWIADWEMLAWRYASDDTVIGFDLHNEPHGAACWGCGDPQVDWRLAAERAGNAVLKANPNLLIIVEGVETHDGKNYWWGGNLKGVADFPVRLDAPYRLVYSAHDYGPGVHDQPWFHAADFPQSTVALWDEMWGYINRLEIAPVLVGEFGGRSVGSDAEGIWQRTLVSYLSANGFHYAYWAINPDGGDTGGLLQEDWRTPEAAKLKLLSSFQYPKIERPVIVSTDALREKLQSLCWVAFAPTNQDPNQGIAPDDASLRADLAVLHAAGFDGLVTYAAEDRVYRFAPEAGFKAMIMGLWNPRSMAELKIAEDAGKSDFIVGFVVGNEGRNARYDDRALYAVMDYLRRATGKPATTTEELGDYEDPALAAMGDWVFPNAHPYWAGIRDPQAAVQWTAERFTELQKRAGERVVMFKEVGLPTAGDPDVDETRQADYYQLLQNTPVNFTYFEAFDQPWKDWAPVEPHWGLFRADRSPKQAVQTVCHKTP